MTSPSQDRRAAERLVRLAQRLCGAAQVRRSRHDAHVDYYDALRSGGHPGLDWLTLLRLANGNLSVVDEVITFLEVDPWRMGSGYEKEEALRRLRHVPLTEVQKARLRTVILTIAATRDGREFRRYCALALNVDGPGFREALATLQRAPLPAIRRRAGWVLDAMANGGHVPRGARWAYFARSRSIESQ